MPHLTFVTINCGRVPLPMSHSPNPHNNLLNAFIPILNNEGIFKKKSLFLHQKVKEQTGNYLQLAGKQE
jgi:hypothetical protein